MLKLEFRSKEFEKMLSRPNLFLDIIPCIASLPRRLVKIEISPDASGECGVYMLSGVIVSFKGNRLSFRTHAGVSSAPTFQCKGLEKPDGTKSDAVMERQNAIADTKQDILFIFNTIFITCRINGGHAAGTS